jgi:hypothetical protein
MEICELPDGEFTIPTVRMLNEFKTLGFEV